MNFIKCYVRIKLTITFKEVKKMFESDNMDEKLTLLFIMDKMEIPLTKNNILDIITRNQWLNYMECIDILNQLLRIVRPQRDTQYVAAKVTKLLDVPYTRDR